ncbi:tRNA uridine-5-carboxymethylaminomethyl(34) synthesis GTPase MnmE [Lysobacteraceae bacterium NML75-0749]|nr:tRNA uridine-5-carboxymethylaminomethyl(34) synthesis GTPase MnmE [Xanthomonadaceae bacterium NML75-0749]PJK02978.1 tRNA uridine-5-carboxymethylaminomethyl(34) synthesis GTPase MnmE [Xanthomonadaceae bacterium NML91-0268]
MSAQTETIVAIATAAAAAGVGIVRLSGSRAREIAENICRRPLPPRRACHARFHDENGEVLDDGIAIFFAAPASFTGEDVAELQAHGSPVVLRRLLDTAVAMGARQARPGEFSERAFLEGKLDLAQTEAIADLIHASSEQAARAARRSLDGVFSQQVEQLAANLMALRVQAEAAIDFADEPLDTLSDSRLGQTLAGIRQALADLLARAEAGQRLRDGLHAVIVGPPNAGKSSLLNALAESDRAIVTDIAGTTRDVLRETVHIAGIELTLVDTAGLRETDDAIEREGIRRAREELQHADLALLVVDAREPSAAVQLQQELAHVPHRILIHNKIDLGDSADAAEGVLKVSAKNRSGLAELENAIRRIAEQGLDAGEGAFSARARHVRALHDCAAWLAGAQEEIAASQPELAAESLRLAQNALGEITGKTLPDDLLGAIFSTFCIGK